MLGLREPNPVVAIRTEDGEAIYIESPHFGLSSFLKGHPVYGNSLVSRLELARLARERDAEEGRSPWGDPLLIPLLSWLRHRAAAMTICPKCHRHVKAEDLARAEARHHELGRLFGCNGPFVEALDSQFLSGGTACGCCGQRVAS